MKRYMIDIETDGFLEDCLRLHCLVAINIDSEEMHVFRPGDFKFRELLQDADVISGHNIVAFDLPALKKLSNFIPSPKTKIVDTMLLSQLNKYNRYGGHSLKNLAKLAGKDQKMDYNGGFQEFSEEMLEYCIADVKANVTIFRELLKEVKFIKTMQPKYGDALKLEHDFAALSAQMTEDGWMINVPLVKATLAKVKVEMAQIELEIEPKLADRIIWLDKEPRQVKLLKDGRMDKTSREWFGHDRPQGKIQAGYEYQRSHQATSDLGNTAQVIQLLEEQGWVPDAWNWRKTENGGLVKGAPKLTESSFETIKGDLGKMVARWRVLRSRRGFLEGMIENSVRGKLHCSQFTLGTHTSRARHKVIVNVPGPFAEYGKEIRSAFTCPDGWKIIGADSSSNQLRGFAYYLGNEEYIDHVINKDIHQHNADILGVSRPVAKTFIYGFLFGAGNNKLGAIVGGGMNEGKALKDKFFEAIPEYPALIKRLTDEHFNNGGWVAGLDGRRIFTESRKALNSLLQAFEAITCRAAYVMIWEELKKSGIPHNINILYHDELSFSVPEEHAEWAAQMAIKCFEEAPKKYGCNIMSGDAKIGDTWYSTH